VLSLFLILHLHSNRHEIATGCVREPCRLDCFIAMVKIFSLFYLNITLWKKICRRKLDSRTMFVVVGCREQGERTRLLLISLSEDKVLKACLLSQKWFPCRRLSIAAVCLNQNFHGFLAARSPKGGWNSSTPLALSCFIHGLSVHLPFLHL